MTEINLYDDRSLAKPGNGTNWVEKAGGLPPNVRARARAIKRENPTWPLSRCIATAINANKHATATGGDLHFKGRQQEGAPALSRHVKATGEWEALKAKNKAKAGKKRKGVNLSDKQSETQPTVTTSTLKKSKKKKGTKADVGSSPAKLAEAIKRFKAKGGDPKGKEAARLKSSKQRLGQKGKLNLSDYPGLFNDDVNLADLVFLKNRRTPEVVADGAPSKKSGGKAGAVKKRKRVSKSELRKKLKAGSGWVREDSSGRKPGQDGYKSQNKSMGPDAPKKNKRGKRKGSGNPLR